MACKTTLPSINLWGMRKIKTANKGDLVELDKEWIELIIEAKNMGIKLKDVMDFLENRMKDGNPTNAHSLNSVYLEYID